MADRYDPELEAWFDGTPYRTDLLQVMDEEVDRVAAKLWRREHVTFPERKFLAYCVWGNLVDAFKYFEYNYQTSWLPHRYLPEHGMNRSLTKTDAVSSALTVTDSHASQSSKTAKIL
jgi:hypothetical protein